jgi:hypothetical protein
MQTDYLTFTNNAPKRQCKKGVDLTRMTSTGPNPMYDNNNYTTCFDLTKFNVNGDKDIWNTFYFDWCKNGTGVTCASKEKQKLWA